MPSDTKNALLDSAERAARSKGFDGFSYADLARDVGIRKASIHHHFPTKADLSIALMQRYYDSFRNVCAEIDARETTGAARLDALIEQYRLAIDGGKTLCLCVSFSTSRASLPEDVIAQISRFRTMMISWIETAFEQGRSDGTIAGVRNPAHEAAATLPLLEGAQLSARAEENPQLFNNAIQLLTSRLPAPV